MSLEEKVRKEFSQIKGGLLLSSPFIGSLLSAVELVVDEEAVPLAGVDKGRTIYINPKRWVKLTDAEKVGTIAHEVLHLAFRHAYREEVMKYDSWLYNIAADAQINHILFSEGFKLPRGVVKLEDLSRELGVPVEKLERMTADSIYRLLEKHMKVKGGLRIGSDGEGEGRGERKVPGIGRDLRPDLGGEGGGKEGDKKEEDWERYWSDAVARAAVVAKQIGKLPAGVERLFDILKPKVNWRRALRVALESGIGSKVVETWRRLNRKHPELPGIRHLGVKRGWVLIDCSGSIGKEELSQFATEVCEISRRFRCELVLLPWDVKVYKARKVKSPSDITRVRFRGGGGTFIKKAVEKVAKEMRALDFVVILSDGVIGDIENAEVRRLLARIASRASSAVFVSSAAEVKLPARWRFIKIS